MRVRMRFPFAVAVLLVFSTAPVHAVCGDGVLDYLENEECDDGGTLAGDGCSGTCLHENCGDGTQDALEECDDANNQSGDGCTSRCLEEPSVSDPTADRYIAYITKRSGRDQNGAPLPFGNKLPRDWFITANDQQIDDADGDDPRVLLVRNAHGLLVPATMYPGAAPAAPDIHYLRYRAKRERDEPYHIQRAWLLVNDLGTTNLLTTGELSLLLPAAMDLAGPPAAVGDQTHYICYQATNNPAAGSTDQNPAGLWDKDMQGFFSDAFDDCGAGNPAPSSQVPTFPATAVEGLCLFDMRRGGSPVRELCHPIDKSDPGFGTASAFISPSTADPAALSLLCYHIKAASKYKTASVAALAGGTLFSPKIFPRQPAHYQRKIRDGNPLYLAPENGFMVPTQASSRKPSLVCLPSRVLASAPAP